MTNTPLMVVPLNNGAYLVRLLPAGAVTRARGTFAVTQPEVEIYDATTADDSPPEGDGAGPLGTYLGRWPVAWLLQRIDTDTVGRTSVGNHILAPHIVTRIGVWARARLRRAGNGAAPLSGD
jgi:hypothetical protein